MYVFLKKKGKLQYLLWIKVNESGIGSDNGCEDPMWIPNSPAGAMQPVEVCAPFLESVPSLTHQNQTEPFRRDEEGSNIDGLILEIIPV